jgi:hypothetical protein
MGHSASTLQGKERSEGSYARRVSPCRYPLYWRASVREDHEVFPYLFVLNLFIIVFGGGGRRGGCGSGCLFWILVSVGITIFINLILLLISLLISGPGPGVNL